MGMDERTVALLGKEKYESLKHKKIIVFGCGGVGGYVIEMLVRSGIENITVVDFDTVSESNLNRQIIATTSNVGKIKVECIKERANQINPNCKLDARNEKLLPENVDKFNLEKYDFVVDCIDMVTSKLALIKYCNKNGIRLVCSMGTGNRCAIPKFEICDIFETKNDGLSKVMRRLLKENGIKHQTVCYTNQDAKKQKVIGSIAYFPAMCGVTIGAYVLNKLLEETNW